jgi:hypothetical protein
MAVNGLTDSLPRHDPKSQELAYNNTTDRFRMELPPFGDMAASGCVAITTPGGSANIPVYLSSHLNYSTDSVTPVSAITETSWTTLTDPGSTASVLSSANSKHTFQYSIASINTSVVVGVSGSLDNSSWFNLDANETNTTHTSNGTYGMTFDGMTKYVRFSFLEENGGTSATIAARYLGGR